MKTFSLKQKDIKKKWYLINAEGLVLGRLASRISKNLPRRLHTLRHLSNHNHIVPRVF